MGVVFMMRVGRHPEDCAAIIQDPDFRQDDAIRRGVSYV